MLMGNCCKLTVHAQASRQALAGIDLTMIKPALCLAQSNVKRQATQRKAL
jgi:hypothetical protein